MKALILDWVANSGEWQSGVVIRSLSHMSEPVMMAWSNSTGVAWSIPSVSYTMAPVMGGHVFPVPPNKNGSLLIIGSDAISVTATTMRTGGGYGFIPVREAKTLQEVIHPYPPQQVSEWFSQPFYTFRPMNNARYNRILQQKVVQFAAMQVYHEFPDRNDRALGVYDACPLSGDPPGHPANSHSANHSLGLDVAYYTLGKNHTQGTGSEAIWNGNALGANFDMPRNARFFSLVKKYLPAAIIMADKRIAYAKSMPQGLLQADDQELFSHHLHAHIHLGEVINWSATI
jgi:hypothetical protein